MTPKDNPLVEPGALMRFDRVAPEHVTPAVDALIASARQTIERATRKILGCQIVGPSASRRRSPARSIAWIVRGARCAT